MVIDAQNVHVRCFGGLESNLKIRVNDVMKSGKNEFLETNCKDRDTFIKALAWNYYTIVENLRLDTIRCPKCGAYRMHLYDTMLVCEACDFSIFVYRVIEDAFKLLE